MTAKYALYDEVDDRDQLTGKVQVVEEEDDIVFDTYETEEEARKEMVRLQAESDRDDKIGAEYLEWEKACMERHSISEDELRTYLCNVIIV